LRKQTLFDFIKSNYQRWPTNKAFAIDHDMSEPHLCQIIKKGYFVEGGRVKTPKGAQAFIDGVEFKIRVSKA